MVQEMSSRFVVKQLDQEDAEDVFALCRTNEIFYQYHPPFVTRESILEDMAALPQGKEPKDKYYLGFYDHRRLAAVMDLILDYPQIGTAYIGFFMAGRAYLPMEKLLKAEGTKE